MALDVGGLDYTISVRDQFTSNVDAFRAGIVGARADFKAFKRELAQPIRSSGQRELAKATREQAQALRDQNRALRSSRKEQKDVISRTKIRSAALRRLNAETRRQAVAQEQARLAVRRGLADARRLRTEDQRSLVAASSLTKILERRTVAQNILAEAQRRGVSLSVEERKRLGLLSTEQERLFAAKQKLIQQQKLVGDAELRRINAETNALRVQNLQLQKQANLRALQSRGLGVGGAPGQRVPPAVENRTFRDRIRNFLDLNKAQGKATLSANRFSFTFRRLIGIFAAFTIVRLIVRGFTDLVRSLITFNAGIEQSRLGIAALFTAVGDVRDATGEAATSAQSLAIAQKEAARQTALLRKEALATAATFDTLLETFQVAVAPGLVAGLDIDEIRRFTVRISQAASAIGLQQNQLAEEIRSILSGTIQARTTRIAVALGITNEDIRLAREAGVLTDFLNDRFIAFKEAGEEALKTFNALLTNVKDSVLLLFELGGLEFFDELKGLLKDILDLTVETDIGDAITPNPKAVAIVRAIADGLRDAVAAARALITEDALGGLAGIAQIIGTTIATIASVLGTIISGILVGLNDVREGFNAVKQIIEDLGLDGDFGQEALKALVKFVVRLATSFAVVGSIALVFLGTIKAITAAIFLIPALLATTTGIIGAIVVGVGFLLAISKKWVESIIGAKLGFLAFLQLVATGVAISFIRAFLFIKTGFQNLFSNFRILILQITAFLADKFLGAIVGIVGVLATVSNTAADALKDIVELQDQINNGLARQIQLSRDAIKARETEFRKNDRALLDILDEETNKLIADSAEKAGDLRTLLADIPGIIARARQPLEAQGNLIKELATDAQKAQDALTFSRDTFGLTGAALTQRRIEFQRLIDLREKGLGLATQERETQRDLLGIERQRVRNSREINRLSDDNQALVANAVENAESLINARNDLARAETEVALARQVAKKASEDELVDANERVAQAEALETAIKAQVTVLEQEQEGLTDVLNTINLTKEAQEAVARVIKNRVVLNGREVLANERLLDIARDRAILEDRINRTAEARIQQAALQTLERDIEDVRRPQVESEARERQQAVVGDTRLAQETVAAENRVRLAEFDLRVIQERNREQIRSLNITLDELRARAEANKLLTQAELAVIEITELEKQRVILAKQLKDENDKGAAGSKITLETLTETLAQTDSLLSTLNAIDLVEDQINQKRKEGVVAISDATEKASGLKDELQRVKDLDIPSIGKQLGDALVDATKELATVGVPIIKQFSQFASDAIVDAFDPTKDVSLKERFARFFQDIARQILELTIRIAILRAFGGVGAATGGQVKRPPNFAARGGAVGPFGMAPGFEGGGVPNKPAPASAIPSNLPATDKVPVWTTVGEWIIRKSAVAKYGNAVMSAINRGLVDPSSLRSLAGIGGRHSVRSRRHSGFQEGGLISDAINDISTQGEAQAAGAEENAPSPIITPVLLTDAQTMRRLLDGGGEVLIDFLRENQGTISTQDSTV